MRKLLSHALQSHLTEVKKKLKTSTSPIDLSDQLETISFALNWRIFKTSKGIYLVGTETKISQAFIELSDAQSYMNQCMYR